MVAGSTPRSADLNAYPTTPLDNDTTALEALRSYREQVKSQGLFSSYQNLEELSTKVRDDLTKLIHGQGQGGNSAGPLPSDGPPGPTPDQPRDIGSALSELRNQLRGYVVKWQTVLQALEDGDFSVDKRVSLASEVESVTLEVLRIASTDAPGAPFVTELSRIGNQAHSVASTRVYLDGGISFGQLTDGCRTLITELTTLVDQEWSPPDAEAT